MSFILIYDIPKEEKVLEVRINRALHSIGAEKIQHSVWRSKRSSELIEIAKIIKQNGGKAIILEERVIF